MWFQRLAEIYDESNPEPTQEPTERPTFTVHNSVTLKKPKVVISTPADFQRVRLMSILQPKEQIAEELLTNDHRVYLAKSTPVNDKIYVRALYDYEADDRIILSFHEGDVIQVITQLESGWWDGVINSVRGWFPSNFCQIISTEEVDTKQDGMNGDQSEEDGEE